jgi:acyl-CoA thioester hydrolase
MCSRSSRALRYFELGRIGFLAPHDQPYQQYVASEMHFATTRVEVDYHRPARFADVVEITVWAEAVRFASLRMAYVLRVGDEIIATGATEHASVDTSGKVCRLPKPRRAALLALVGKPSAGYRPRGPNVWRVLHRDSWPVRIRDRRACAILASPRRWGTV